MRINDNSPRILWFLASHPNSTRAQILDALPHMAETTLRGILYKSRPTWFRCSSGHPSKWGASSLGLLALERHLIAKGQLDDALHITRLRFEATYAAIEPTPVLDPDGSYRNVTMRNRWAVWRAAVGLT